MEDQSTNLTDPSPPYSAGRAIDELAAARQRLLDLTMRNPLLNYRERKTRTIRIVDENPRELFDRLVIREKDMAFLARPAETVGDRAGEDVDEPAGAEASTTVPAPTNGASDGHHPGDLTAAEQALLWRPPAVDDTPGPRHTDRYLQTDLETEELQRRLFYVRQQARTVWREQGYTVHYLALGFVKWFDPQDDQELRAAPLILVPVELQRTRVGARFKLVWNGDDVLTNISLQEKLAELGVALPEFNMPEDKAGVDDYLMAVTEAIADHPGWQITAEVALDFFSFTKFVMYKDLDPAAWPTDEAPSDHPLVSQVLDPRDGAVTTPAFDEQDIDDRLNHRDLYYVMDADPSQIAVIEDVKAGRNLVVEGPPGTGKSQTITNLIAELLAAGHSVLFVSEKMAALEVVKSRLDRVGLGDYCLELHSRKTRKKEVLRELDRTLNVKAPRSVNADAEFAQLADLTDQLNEYAAALRTPVGSSGATPYDLLEQIERSAQMFAHDAREQPTVALPADLDPSAAELQEAAQALTALGDAIQLVDPVRTHPWFGTDPRATLPSDEQDIAALIDDTRAALNDVVQTGTTLAEATALRPPATPAVFDATRAAADVLACAPHAAAAILHNSAWDEPDTTALPLIDDLAAFDSRQRELQALFVDKAFNTDMAAMLEEYKQESARFLRFLSARYRYLKREISMLYRSAAPSNIEQRIADLGRLVDLEETRTQLMERSDQGRALFGDLWNDDHSAVAALREFSEWMIALRTAYRADIVSDATLDLIATELDRDTVAARRDAFSTCATTFVERYGRLCTRLSVDCDLAFGCQANDVTTDRLGSWLDALAAARPQLQHWSQFRARYNKSASTCGAPAARLVLERDIRPHELLPAFEAAVAEAVLRLAMAERTALANFVGTLHDTTRQRFAEVDGALIQTNRQRLARLMYERRPRVHAGAPPGSEAGILQGEFNRKRGHMPIRRLLSRAGGLIQRIKPCFMMSPLSIAQYLDPRTARFDVVIFDEASQVRPEDALGALLRGRQLVVMGDTRQLPPTSFFDHMTDPEELEDDSTSVAEVESILHQCKRSFATRSLRWHYRSRHQSLIAVSNQEFYDNRLNVYPSPVDHDEYLGLQFRHLPDTIYDRGKHSVNRGEARAVVSAAMELFSRYPDKTLGIGAFNVRQQQAILEEVELQLKQHPQLEAHFAEDRVDEFFVKNLETIQGDERDIILISVGFGFDEHGKLSRNFGPLNQEGGERRLNVLITRARERCVVFSNFTAEQLDLGSDSPRGLRALGAFLDYANRRHLRTIDEAGDAIPHFERGILEFLRSKGYDVRPQLGCASYRVDLAVVDPQVADRFLLGVECDGPRYHDARVARDRDRLRDQVLRGLGWDLHRMWALDWHRNRQDCADRLLVRLAAAGDADTRPAYAAPAIEAVQYEDGATAEPLAAEAEIEPYVQCPRKSVTGFDTDLHDLAAHELAEIIAVIVDVEGPVHMEEVVRRLRTWWELSRAGTRVREAIDNATIEAVGMVRLRRDPRDFLWPMPERPVSVRRRTDDPPPRIELICDEEIAAAAARVVELYHAALPDALARQVARMFGVKAVTSPITERIQRVITSEVAAARLVQLPNGMIDRAERQGHAPRDDRGASGAPRA